MKKQYIYALATVFIWATMAAIVKKMLFDIPNLEALSISSYFAFLFMLLVNLKTGVLKEMKQYSVKEYRIMSGLGFLGLFLYSVLYYYGLSQLSSQEACILNYLWPIMLVAFSCVILKERMTAMKAVAMVCSFIGIIILSMGDGGASTGNTTLGIISCVIAAACYGLFSVLNKKADFNQNISMMVIWLVVAVCATILGIMTEDWVPIKGIQWLGILWLGIVIDAVAYLLWALALKGVENTAKIANLAYLTPFLSVLISAVFLKERIQAQALLALIFIVGGILLQNFYEHKHGK
ncbi:MAG: DMT family transporter [Lachnospiraceae bacterium]|nr:DMT family transporter [Lachnospiraceae bacterium]